MLFGLLIFLLVTHYMVYKYDSHEASRANSRKRFGLNFLNWNAVADVNIREFKDVSEGS